MMVVPVGIYEDTILAGSFNRLVSWLVMEG